VCIAAKLHTPAARAAAVSARRRRKRSPPPLAPAPLHQRPQCLERPVRVDLKRGYRLA
jgi:hypothetical protein